jgi:hypothetical protein
LGGTTAATPVEAWFQDEARVGQKGSLSHVWAPIGSRPLMVRDNRHDTAYIFGAICPDRGVGAAVITPAANTEMHEPPPCRDQHSGCAGLDHRSDLSWRRLAPTQRRHQTARHIVLLSLPPYAPELNSMENVWDFLRANKLSADVWDSYDEIVEACADAWNWLVNDLGRVVK